jgi:hypothetical protein
MGLVRVALAVLLVAAPGCSGDAGQCNRSSDCPAGQVCADGVCTPKGTDGGKPDAEVDLSADLGLDQGQLDYATVDGDAGLTCTPNNNGKVEREEVLFQVPSKVTVTRGTGLTVDLEGTSSGGVTTWDLTGAASDDKKVELRVDPVPAWTAAKFPTATYASKLMAKYGYFTKVDLLGVFRATPTALKMLGAVSDTKDHTRMTYNQPLDALRFPVTVGDSYTSSSGVSGITEYAVPVALTESYTNDVLARGKLRLLPNFTLDALLVRVRQVVYPTVNPLLKTKTTVFLFVVECYGTVARVVAETDPGTALEKVKAKERWKLAGP